MKSIKELYKIGRGPSSSHTMGPEKASRLFLDKNSDAERFEVTLYGSLANTGKGHMTDAVIASVFEPRPCEIIFNYEAANIPHPNTMMLRAFKGENTVDMWLVMSVGGGTIEILGQDAEQAPDIYPHKSFAEIKAYCIKEDLRLPQYVMQFEGPELYDYLLEIYDCMKNAIRDGLRQTGELAGGLHIERKAKQLYQKHHIDESPQTRESRIICSYAFAVSEQNASCGMIVTAPTCGASGVLPSVLKYMQEKKGFTDQDIVNALCTAGVIGNLIKENASISGAECGCQAEVGSACAMASAALAELFGMELDQIEYAAETAIEHHLGLTCDPIKGLVQIPCIERNAVAAMRAIDALHLANFLTHTRKISFDLVVETMKETGRDMSSLYRETSEGGLAKLYK